MLPKTLRLSTLPRDYQTLFTITALRTPNYKHTHRYPCLTSTKCNRMGTVQYHSLLIVYRRGKTRTHPLCILHDTLKFMSYKWGVDWEG
jgi:hypothetical protein